MSAVQQVEWEECFIEPRPDATLEREVKNTVGFSMPATKYFSVCPWIVRSFIALHPYRFGQVFTSFPLSELVALVVSQDNSCRYCYASTRLSMRLLGAAETRIEELEHDLSSADLSAPEKAALEFARRVSRASPLACRDDWQILRQAGFEDLAVKELAFIAAGNVYFNRAMTLPAMPIGMVERLPDRWFFRFLRPLIARIFRNHQHRGQLEEHPVDAGGPYAYLVQALDRLPAAKALNQVLEGAWGSTILPRRTKAMVFAVVARGLGCPRSEEEASSILIEEGLDAGDVEEILARLASPKLDDVETAVVPFARETIRYRPAQIQRRGRELRARLSNEQFVELVGVAALANALCRMSVIVDPPEA